MTIPLFALILALIWTVATGAFSVPNLVLGLAIAVLAMLVLRDRLPAGIAARRLGRIMKLALFFAKELVVSALQVALLALTPNLKNTLRPAIIAVPLSVKTDMEITLLANLVTLTPGTLSIDVAEDRSVLYIHVLLLKNREALIEAIALGFQARIAAVFA